MNMGEVVLLTVATVLLTYVTGWILRNHGDGK